MGKSGCEISVEPRALRRVNTESGAAGATPPVVKGVGRSHADFGAKVLAAPMDTRRAILPDVSPIRSPVLPIFPQIASVVPDIPFVSPEIALIAPSILAILS
jgi:hypothetical protein